MGKYLRVELLGPRLGVVRFIRNCERLVNMWRCWEGGWCTPRGHGSSVPVPTHLCPTHLVHLGVHLYPFSYPLTTNW